MSDEVNTQPSELQITPFILIIFGITGDLAKRKVLPALYHLLKDNLLPQEIAIVGTSRRALQTDDFLKQIELCVLEADNACDPEVLSRFARILTLQKLDPIAEDDYTGLKKTLDAIEAAHGTAMNRLFYLSIPPQVYSPIVRHLGQQGLTTGSSTYSGEVRLLVEKPFGYDLRSAEDLITVTAHEFDESQLFRIDHYLAKESAQNILTFREQNPLFSRQWDAQHITSIEVLAAEKIGIEGRADFYEQVGALRDLIQSHLMQLLALITMELPDNVNDSDAIHASKQALLSAVKPPAADHMAQAVTRGQYEGYLEEVKNPDSTTETFASITLSIDNERWRGVPIRITTGKALDEKKTIITLLFMNEDRSQQNILRFRVQPNEGIDVELMVKQPGFSHSMQTAHMEFTYQSTFEEEGHPDAYERVLVDAARGDHALFATSEEVLASWRILQPILDYWQKQTSDMRVYAQGSNGPELEL